MEFAAFLRFIAAGGPVIWQQANWRPLIDALVPLLPSPNQTDATTILDLIDSDPDAGVALLFQRIQEVGGG